MPEETFAGVYKYLGQEWGKKRAKSGLRLYFQDIDQKEEPLSLLVWWDAGYRPYKGAGPSFRDAVPNSLYHLVVGETIRGKQVLMSAELVQQALMADGGALPYRPKRWLRKHPKLKACVYTQTASVQIEYLLGPSSPDDEILEARVNNQSDQSPYPLIQAMFDKAELSGVQAHTKRILMSVKIFPSIFQDIGAADRVFQHVHEAYLEAYPKLMGQDYCTVRRTFNGYSRYLMCYAIVKDEKEIKLPNIMAVTEGIYDNSRVSVSE